MKALKRYAGLLSRLEAVRRTAALPLFLCFTTLPLFSEEISVVVGGNFYGAAQPYRIGSDLYLSAKEAGSIFGTQVYWYPVSGRVRLQSRGETMEFVAGSDRASWKGREIRLSSKVLLRGDKAWIPLGFLLSGDFGDFAGRNARYDPGSQLLNVENRSNLGALRYFSYGDKTRITLEMKSALSYHAAKKGLGRLDLVIPRGAVESQEQLAIEDRRVSKVRLSQEKNLARLSVYLEDPGLSWKVHEAQDPQRLVVEVDGDGAARAPEPASMTLALQGEAPGLGAEISSASAQQSSAPPAPAVSARKRVVVDAGHGGKDPGARGIKGILEKDVNLWVAKEIAELLRQEGRFEVMLTRGSDVFVSLPDRSRMANEFKADLFVSVHCNFSPDTRDKGFEVYFLSEKASDPEAENVARFENASLELSSGSEEDKTALLLLGSLQRLEFINEASELSGLISRQVFKRLDLENRGVKQAAFYVLRGTLAPAVLVEMGFISNRADAAKLQSKIHRRKLVDSIYAGVLDYAKRKNWD